MNLAQSSRLQQRGEDALDFLFPLMQQDFLRIPTMWDTYVLLDCPS